MYVVDYYTKSPVRSDYWIRKQETFERLSDAYVFIIMIDRSGDDSTSRFISLTNIW